jgi:hypothetical protein
VGCASRATLGTLRVLPIAATYRASLHVHAERSTAASSLIEEADAIVQATAWRR